MLNSQSYCYLQLSDSTSEAFITALNTLPEDVILVSRDFQARHNVAMPFTMFTGSEREVYQLCICESFEI
jgi:hypothetical protein